MTAKTTPTSTVTSTPSTPTATPATGPATHALYLHAVRDVVVGRAMVRGTITPAQAERLAHTKLLYGVGDGSYHGVTVCGAWQAGGHNGGHSTGHGGGRVDIVEVAATGQESWVQLAGP